MDKGTVHEFGNGFSRFVHRLILQEFSQLIEDHHSGCFRILLDRNSAHGGNRHQKLLVKDLAAQNVAYGRQNDIISGQKIGNQTDKRLVGIFQ